MSFKTNINRIRRRIMYRLTKSVGSSYQEPNKGELNHGDFKNILIIRPNHRLGNQLLLTPLVQEVIDTFPDCEIDLFVKGGVAFPVFKNYPQVKNIIALPKKPFNHLIKYAKCWFSIKKKSYDLVINGDKNSSSGKLLTNMAKTKLKIFGDVDNIIKTQYPDSTHISKYPIYNLRFTLEKLGFEKKEKPLPLLDIRLNSDEIKNGKTILDSVVKPDKKTICLFTNATGAKCYSEVWWHTFYSRLLKEYPDYHIIEMLPVENISKINFEAPHFYSKDIREMAGIIRNTSIFIAADNGVMHLASASLTPTIGFFLVTEQDVYGPYGNGSMPINTNQIHIEDWITAINSILKN
ncbi:MAG: glycosyltransferase family 9 protein [Aestuariibaculum sp.]